MTVTSDDTVTTDLLSLGPVIPVAMVPYPTPARQSRWPRTSWPAGVSASSEVTLRTDTALTEMMTRLERGLTGGLTGANRAEVVPRQSQPVVRAYLKAVHGPLPCPARR